MNLTLSTDPTTALVIPIRFLFSGSVLVYILHVLEESVLGETFVAKMRRRIWPAYGWTHFCGFNTLMLTLNLLAILAYDLGGGHWIIWPVAMMTERALNGVWHLAETIATRRFSSGLMTSIPMWMLYTGLIRYSLLRGQIDGGDFAIAFVLGTGLTGAMFGSMQAMRRKMMG